MATAGPNASGTQEDDASVGSIAWASLTNVAIDDGLLTTASNLLSSAPSHYLKLTNFGFNLPVGATVNGITVSIQRSKPGAVANQVRDSNIKIVKTGVIGSTNKADLASNWPGTEAAATYGGVADLWGETWAYTDINASTFGVAISVTATSTKVGVQARIDYVSITITYTAAAGGSSTVTRIFPKGLQSRRKGRGFNVI